MKELMPAKKRSGIMVRGISDKTKKSIEDRPSENAIGTPINRHKAKKLKKRVTSI